jgi:hypothetical protein
LRFARLVSNGPSQTSDSRGKEEAMKTRAGFALALVGALSSANAPLQAAEAWSSMKLRPRMAVSFDEGDKHVVGYFLSEGRACKLTLMIGASLHSLDERRDASPSRVLVRIPSGRSVQFDTIEGKTVSFSCEEDARSMNAVELDHLASSN